MSELLDKQVNAQKENLKKYFRGSHELPQAHEKVCDEDESRKNKLMFYHRKTRRYVSLTTASITGKLRA